MSQLYKEILDSFDHNHQSHIASDRNTNFRQPDTRRKPLSISQITASSGSNSNSNSNLALGTQSKPISPVILPSQDHFLSNLEHFQHHQQSKQKGQGLEHTEHSPSHFEIQLAKQRSREEQVQQQQQQQQRLGLPYHQQPHQVEHRQRTPQFLNRSYSQQNILSRQTPPPQQQHSNREINRAMSFTMFSPNPASPLYPSTSANSIKPSNERSNSHHNVKNIKSNKSSSPPAKKFKHDSHHNHHNHHPHNNNELFFGSSSLHQQGTSPIPTSQPIVSSTRTTLRRERTPENENEDQRFLRLARDALVATAQGINEQNRGIVDPTILDLLTRLQYASSPHGNPISNLKHLEANENGQLNVQGFYQNFPNLSNNIFTGSPHGGDGGVGLGVGAGVGAGVETTPGGTKADEYKASEQKDETIKSAPLLNSRHHPAGNEQGWNFLIGEALHLKADSERNPMAQLENTSVDFTAAKANNARQLVSTSRKKFKGEGVRKFPCDKCSMSFRRSSDLKRHEKQHLSIPPNICEFCGKGFARKDALKRHVGTLTCKRNANKKLYIENLEHLNGRGGVGGIGAKSGDIDELSEDEGEDEEEDGEEAEEEEDDEVDGGENGNHEGIGRKTVNEYGEIGKRDDNEHERSGGGISKNNTQKNKKLNEEQHEIEDDDEEEIQRKFPTYGYQKENWQ